MKRDNFAINFLIFSLMFVWTMSVQGENTQPIPVDLGLSVKWSDRDLGAISPNSIGDFYAWGEIEARTDIQKSKNTDKFTRSVWLSKFNLQSWDDLKLAPLDEKKMNEMIGSISADEFTMITKPIGKWNLVSDLYGNVFVRNLNSANDIVTKTLGPDWRMPTYEEWCEFRLKCTISPSVLSKNGTDFVEFVGPNGNKVFFPLAGYCVGGSKSKIEDKKKHVSYWSSSVLRQKDWYGNNRTFILTFDVFNKNHSWINYTYPWEGLCIRPVYDPKGSGDKKVVNENKKNENISLEWLGLTKIVHKPKIDIKVGIKSKEQIISVNLYVNGQISRGIKTVPNDGYDMVLSDKVNLQEGDNILSVSVTTQSQKYQWNEEVNYSTLEKFKEHEDTKPVIEKNKETAAHKEKRIALVVGNSAYLDNELPNPVNDASDMAIKLQSLGFEVVLLKNASHRELDNKISEFACKAAGFDVAMFYYAGHGIQYNGANYLIPIDAILRSAKDIEYECTDVNRVLSNMEDSGCKMNIICLDACRNNPFERSWMRSGGKQRGLSAINAPIGTFISYATAPGSTAADGISRNSPYTAALLQVLDTRDLPIETVFKRVASLVYNSTSHQQIPWYSSSLFNGDFIFNK